MSETHDIAQLTRAADGGDPNAQFELGTLYQVGKGVAEDPGEALLWYQKAARRGHVRAQCRLATMYELGLGIEEDLPEAFKWYRMAAEQGYAEAQYELAGMYNTGRGVDEDEAKAAEWFLKAAEQGYAAAQFKLGIAYEMGQGVEEDAVEANRWYRQAAEQGDADAQWALGINHRFGIGMEEDKAEALKWYRLAAEQDHVQAQCDLAKMYEDGDGVEKDDAEAVKWFTRAAENGNASAQWNVGWNYAHGRGVLKNEGEAAKWYRKAAEQGHSQSQFDLGVMYANGRGVPQNAGEAVVWYRKAADQGHARAQWYLGWMYENGRGVSADPAAAVKWYRKAAEQDNIDAQFSLASMFERGAGVAMDLNAAREWYRKSAEKGHEKAQAALSRLQAADEMPSATQRNTTETTGKRGAEPCKALLDTCTPLVYRENAFRITGLFVDASARDIKRRIDDLRQAEEMGEAEAEHVHTFALKPPPSVEQIRTAAKRLQDAERRLIEEFFWFWPQEWGKGKEDLALKALAAGDKNAAFQLWHAALTDEDADRKIVAKHNLAVMYQLVALDCEYVALEQNLPHEDLARTAEYWRTSFKWWEELTVDDVFWGMVTSRIRDLDDARLSTSFAGRMRQSLPEAMDKINAMLAVSFAERGQMSQVKQHLTYMRETHQGADNVSKTLSMVTAPLCSRVSLLVENASAALAQSTQQADAVASNLIVAVKGSIEILTSLLPEDDHQHHDVPDSVAVVLMSCAEKHGRATEGWVASLEILQQARSFARSREVKQDLKKAQSSAEEQRDWSYPAVKRLGHRMTEAKQKKQLDAIKHIYTHVPSLLVEIETVCTSRSSVYQQCCDSVAATLRGYAIDIHNTAMKIDDATMSVRFAVLSIELHDRARSVACGREAKAKLAEDENTVSALRSALEMRGFYRRIAEQLQAEGLLPPWGAMFTHAPAPPRLPRAAGAGAPSSGCLVVFGLGLLLPVIALSAWGMVHRVDYSTAAAQRERRPAQDLTRRMYHLGETTTTSYEQTK